MTVLSLVLAAIFIAALASYARYAMRRFGPDMEGLKPRGWRALLFWCALAVTVVILIPGGALAVAYATGVADCPAQAVPGMPWQCSADGRGAIALVGIVVGLPLVFLWVRFLRQKLASPRG